MVHKGNQLNPAMKAHNDDPPEILKSNTPVGLQ